MKLPYIKICLPSMYGLSIDTQRDLNVLIADKRFNWYNPQPDVIRGTYIDQARERCVANTQAEFPEIPLEISHLLWIDDDISGFNGDLLEEMISSREAIIGAAYPQKYDQSLLAAGNWNDRIRVLPEPFKISTWFNILTVVQCEWVGLGFCLIRANVFRELSRPWFDRPTIRWQDKGNQYFVDEIGEDVNFCKKAAMLGYQTYIYTKRILTHKERKMEEKAVATKPTESKNAFDVQQFNQLLGALQNAQDELTKSNAIITEFKRAAIDALNKQQKRIEELEAKNTKEKIDTNDN
jgi:hypothetical protein